MRVRFKAHRVSRVHKVLLVRSVLPVLRVSRVPKVMLDLREKPALTVFRVRLALRVRKASKVCPVRIPLFPVLPVLLALIPRFPVLLVPMV
jgi:hypothetical protein